MNETTFDPAAASGEGNYRGARNLVLNEVSLNGNADPVEQTDGSFKIVGGNFRKKILVGKPKDEKPQEIDLGKSITVVFLKIRRKLIERGKKGEILRSTSEHNSKKDAVTLYDSNSKDRVSGVAEDLRSRYEGLRTVQIVYALLVPEKGEPELVRLIIKGASLGSEAKAENVMDFYQYLGSFTGEEHMYQFKTVLTPVLEKGQRTYYAIEFKRGEKLSDKSYGLAMEQLKIVHDKCVEIDTSRAAKIVKTTTTAGDVVPGTDDDDAHDDDAAQGYPTTEIDPDSIPF